MSEKDLENKGFTFNIKIEGLDKIQDILSHVQKLVDNLPPIKFQLTTNTLDWADGEKIISSEFVTTLKQLEEGKNSDE